MATKRFSPGDASDDAHGTPNDADKTQEPGEQDDSPFGDGDDVLRSLGYKPELQRTRSTRQVAFMAFVLASVPYGLATTLSNPIAGGGPVNIIWGWLAVSSLIVCVAASLGEITSVYPVAGGVYYQTFAMAPARWRRQAAWLCGWLYAVGNISITLSVTFGTTSFVVACVDDILSVGEAPLLGGDAWKVYLIFVAVTLLSNAVSALGNRWLPWLDAAAVFWTLVGITATVVAALAVARHGRRGADWAFGHFENSTGWPDGWSFCVGLLHAAYATSSTGMITSMCEEVRIPAIQVPRAMVATVFINTLAGLLFLVPITFLLPDLQLLVDLASAQPVPTILKSAIGSPGGAFALTIPIIVLGLICGIGCTTASSRCLWAFARDGAIPGGRFWMIVHPRLGVPLNAMMLSMVVQILLGLIYFGSSAAFNAFSGVGVLTLNAAYATPILINICTSRRMVKHASFSLGRWGYPANIVAVAWSVFAVPLFCMPLRLPVTAVTVNYASVVFVAAGILSGVWYVLWGHENYRGPPLRQEVGL